MVIFAVLGGEKTKPIQSQSRLAPRPALGVEKTKPKPAFGRKYEARSSKSETG